ncbi:MAG: hypothetical protein HQ475_04365 [SAR202 cluster bacterium]|nr:hypothetical protein [SAR202 cluster bacterium]
MTVPIPAAVIFSIFFLLSAVTFSSLLSSWHTQSGNFSTLQEHHVDRINSSLSITSAGPTATDLDCNNFTATVVNTGSLDIVPVENSDVLAEYTNTAGTKVTSYLDYATTAVTGSRWTVTSFSPDTRQPNLWNPQETATLKYSIPSSMKADAYGPLLINSPIGADDVGYFQCPEFLYLHSETTNIAGTDYYKLTSGVTAEVSGSTISSAFAAETIGRIRPTSNNGKSTFLLTESDTIPASTWTATYRVKRDKEDLGFVWSENATDISLVTTGSWQDIDLSAAVPAGAAGAIVEVVNAGTVGTYSGMVRGKNDTNNYMADPLNGLVYPSSHRWQVVAIDSNRTIQGYIENADIDFKLLGYTIGSDPAYFTVPSDITPGTTAAWTTVDVSAYVDADADGVILLIDNIENTARNYGIREVGSSFSTTTRKSGPYENTMYMVGIDGSNQFDAYIENSNVKVYLVGQTKGSVVYYTDDVAVTDPTLGSWQQLDADINVAPAVSSDAVGLLFWAENTDAAVDYRASFRDGDSTDDWNGDIQRDTHLQAAVGLTTANVWDEFIEHAAINVSVAGYTRLVRIDVHADIDILIRDAAGTVRATLATDVASSANITSATWQTLTATYAFSEYTVVDATDYIEIDLFANVPTTNISGESVSVDFRLDDNTLPAADQTRVALR